jgi:hypothetical protein
LGVELDLIAKRDPSEAGKLEHQVAEELERDAHQDQGKLEKSGCPMINKETLGVAFLGVGRMVVVQLVDLVLSKQDFCCLFGNANNDVYALDRSWTGCPCGIGEERRWRSNR